MTTSSSHIENYDQSKYWVAPDRNFRTSARLHIQHFLVQNTIDFLLEPTIERYLAASSSQQLRVADLGCGNGAWLTELHTHFAKNSISASLEGFDKNPTLFPHAAYLPASVSLKQLDILAKPLPAELIGAYDVVHIRAFGSATRSCDPVLTLALELLKPGGFLQWDEIRGDRFIVESPSPQVSKASCDRIAQVLQGGLQAQGIQHDWVDALDKHLVQFGFENVRLLAQDNRKQDYKGWTENYLMVWEELASLFPTKAEAPNAPLSREEWTALFENGVKETEQGVMVHQGRVLTAVGQKPR